MKEIVDDEQYMLSGNLKEMLAKYEDSEDLINVGAYVRGSNPEIDRAIELKRPIDAFLRQDIDKSHTFEETKKQLKDIFKEEPKGEE